MIIEKIRNNILLSLGLSLAVVCICYLISGWTIWFFALPALAAFVVFPFFIESIKMQIGWIIQNADSIAKEFERRQKQKRNELR